jgi:hypothetical protein
MRTRLLILLAFVLAGIGLTGPAAARSQVWVLVHAHDKDKSEGTVDLQMPIEAVKDMDGDFACDKDKTEVGSDIDHSGSDEDRDDDADKDDRNDRGTHVQGRDIYRQYHDLPVGEERVVETSHCDESTVEVRVACRELSNERSTGRLRVVIRDRSKDGDNKNLDFGISIDTLQDLGGFLRALGVDTKEDDIKGLEKMPGGLDLLKSLPPFEMARIVSEDAKIVVRLE